MNVPLTSTPLVLSHPKHLDSGDRIWILAGVETSTSSYYPWSKPQKLFDAGAIDLREGTVKVVSFGNDIALAMLVAGVPPPPWRDPLSCAICIHRRHKDAAEGRSVVTVTLEPLAPEMIARATEARRALGGIVSPDPPSIDWKVLSARAERIQRIHSAALAQPDWFSAGDVAAITGEPPSRVGVVLARMVENGRLEDNEKAKRWKRYRIPRVKILDRNE